MKISTLVSLLLISVLIFAQKEDRNWVFGYQAGIDFNDLNNPLIFKSNSKRTIETAGSISDENGNLIMYIGDTTISPFGLKNMYLFNGNNELISNKNILHSLTCAKGLLFLKKINSESQYYIFYSGFHTDSLCLPPNLDCFALYYSLVDISINNGNGGFIIKDKLLLETSIEEGIASVKHANGKEWWLIAHQSPSSLSSNCTNSYYKFLVTQNGIKGPYIQDQSCPKRFQPTK